MSKLIYQKTKEVYNTLGEKYFSDSIKGFSPERLPFTQRLEKNSVVLDVGCGGGRDSKFFVQKGLKVVGVDVSDVLIKIARKEVPKAKFICGDILDLKLKLNSFDGIWAEAILLHLKRKDVIKAVRIFHKILKPGGLVHVSVKKGRGEKFVKEKLSGWNERFYTYFSKKEMEVIFSSIGFQIKYSKILPDPIGRKNVSWVVISATK